MPQNTDTSTRPETEEAPTPSIDTGCRCCGEPWPDTQTIVRQPDGTWRTSCLACGEAETWVWPAQVDTGQEAQVPDKEEETDVTVWDVEELQKRASRLRDPNQFLLACLINAVEEQWERRLDDLRRELAREVRTRRLVVATEDGYEGVVAEVDADGADVTLYCPRGADDQADYTGIKLAADRRESIESAGLYLSGAGNILGSFDLIQDEDDAKVFETSVDVGRGSGPVAGEGMRLNSDGVTVPPWRRHARLAAVEAQAERIAEKIEQLSGVLRRVAEDHTE